MFPSFSFVSERTQRPSFFSSFFFFFLSFLFHAASLLSWPLLVKIPSHGYDIFYALFFIPRNGKLDSLREERINLRSTGEDREKNDLLAWKSNLIIDELAWNGRRERDRFVEEKKKKKKKILEQAITAKVDVRVRVPLCARQRTQRRVSSIGIYRTIGLFRRVDMGDAHSRRIS